MRTVLLLALTSAVLAGCVTRTVHQEDLDAWKGVPAEALDTHTIFATLPMTKNVTSSGLEVRTYSNRAGSAACATAPVGSVSMTSCRDTSAVCTAVVYIRDQRVVEMVAQGQCYTDARSRPEPRYLELMKR